MNSKRVIGKIVKISEKGYGFIVSREIPFTRIFFHWTSLNQDTAHFSELTKGMEVEFTPIESPDKGTKAIKIDVLEPVEPDKSDKNEEGMEQAK